MIANLLPNQATHSSLDLFEKQPLLITFENAFDQKIGPVYSPNGPMLEFEITGDRNNFVDLQKIYLEIRCKVTQSNGADLRYDNTDPTVSDSPFSLTVPSLLMDSKSQMPIVILRIKALLEQNFLTAKEPRTHGLSVRDIVLKTIPLQKMQLISHLNENWSVNRGKFGSMDPLELIFSHVTSIC